MRMKQSWNETNEIMTYGLLARVVRWFFLCRAPVVSRVFIWIYIKVTQAKLYNHALNDFDCLLSFFLRDRDLRAKMRGQDLVPGFVSPVEGVVQFWGRLSHNSTLPIKGAGFTVAKLLGFEAPFLQTGIVFSLSWGNYHHVHAPTDMVVEEYIEIPGRLRRTNSASLNKHPLLYAENYRQVIVARTEKGERFVLVLVGAKHIGNISCPKLAGFEGGDKVSFSKGEEIGYFSLGSSVVLLLDQAVASQKNKGDLVDVIDMLFSDVESS